MSNRTIEQEFMKTKFKNFLGARDVFKDLKELPKKFQWFLVLGIVIVLVFNFVSVTAKSGESRFLPLQQYDRVLVAGSVFGQNESSAIAVAVLYSLNGLAAFTGVLAVAMIAYNRASQYFWGLINAVFFGLFALSVGYVGDFFMNIILIVGASVGWYLFEIVGLGNKKQKTHSLNWNLAFYLLIVLITFFVIMMWYWALSPAATDLFGKSNNQYVHGGAGVNGQTLQVLDGISSGMNTVGYVMQLTNMSQQFYIWFFLNIVKILKFTGLAGRDTLNVNMLIQFGVWFTISLIGLYKRNFESLFAKYFTKKK